MAQLLDAMDPDDEPFQVTGIGGVFQVVDATGAVQLAGGDEANARQYAVLLNAAYRRGYKAGYRNGRASVRPPDRAGG